jgi:type III secretory pathway component EscV
METNHIRTIMLVLLLAVLLKATGFSLYFFLFAGLALGIWAYTTLSQINEKFNAERKKKRDEYKASAAYKVKQKFDAPKTNTSPLADKIENVRDKKIRLNALRNELERK